MKTSNYKLVKLNRLMLILNSTRIYTRRYNLMTAIIIQLIGRLGPLTL